MSEALDMKIDDHTAAMERLDKIRAAGVWPRGRRDLWPDALGVVLLLSLYQALGDQRYLREAEWVAREVDRVLGARRGIRMADRPDAPGQSFRSQALWIFALQRLGRFLPEFQTRALALVREIHAPFVRPGEGILSRMDENLSSPFPGSEPGKLEVFLGLSVYRLVGPEALRPEIDELEGMVGRACRSLAPDNGADLGLLLWLAHFFPDEPLSLLLRERALMALDARWITPPGYFRRSLSEPWNSPTRSDWLAVTNLSAAVGLQAQGVWVHRVQLIRRYFRETFPWDPKPGDSLAPILHAISLYPGLLLRD
jgi:hypothetical protein